MSNKECYFCKYDVSIINIKVKEIEDLFGVTDDFNPKDLICSDLDVCEDCFSLKVKRKRKKRGANKRYFTKVHENAIVKYNNSICVLEKGEIYNEIIKDVFIELIDKVVYTYKFNTLPNIDYLKEDCAAWIPTVMDKYDNSRGTAAFSFFTVIIKNWFIYQVKDIKKRSLREVEVNNPSAPSAERQLITSNPYIKDREKREFWEALIYEMSDWETRAELKEEEELILKAIKILLSSSEEIEIFNKKAIYLYMNEITGMPTKQVIESLERFRKRYKTFKNKWNNGKI